MRCRLHRIKGLFPFILSQFCLEKWGAIGISIFLCPLFLTGKDLESRISSLEKSMERISSKTMNDAFGANFVGDDFEKEWVSLFLSGEALYWCFTFEKINHLDDFLIKKMTLDLSKEKKLKNDDMNWGWGFRITLGLIFSRIDYELISIGTRYSTDQIDSNSSHLGSSSFDVSYDALSFELKKSFFLSRFLSTSASIGVKRSWISQEHELSDFYFPLRCDRVKDLYHFQGTGPCIAFGSKCHLFWGMNLTGEIGGALLYGIFDVEHRENLVELGEFSSTANTHLFSTEFDFSIGLGWNFYTNHYHLEASIHYETLYTYRYNQSLKMEDILIGGIPLQRGVQMICYAEDVTFYGVVLRALIEF